MHSQFDLEVVPVQNAETGWFVYLIYLLYLLKYKFLITIRFEVHPPSATGRTPVMIKVTGAAQLDYEDPNMREMVVKIVARGGARLLSSTATLTVTLLDVNDNKPAFKQPS